MYRYHLKTVTQSSMRHICIFFSENVPRVGVKYAFQPSYPLNPGIVARISAQVDSMKKPHQNLGR